MRNIRLLIEYDGTAFAGWQVQPGLRTVQGVLEERLGTMTGERVTLIGSGRTDAGVHARGQTANFKTASAAPVRAFCQGLNGVLPRDIAILHAEEAAEEFHARYGARARVYRYSIIRRRSPILERYAWRFGHLIDETVMHPLSAAICGVHDFSGFCSARAEVRSHQVDVYRAVWMRHDEQLLFEIEASRFLHHMVRMLVGTMVEVARGRFSQDDFLAMLERKDGAHQPKTAPACGLCLMEVKY